MSFQLYLPPGLERLREETPKAGPSSPAYPVVPREPGIGAARNLHLFVERRYREWNDYLLRAGGLNPHGEPKYRIVWGWERPDLYGGGDARYLEYFHLERWMPMDLFIDEEDWDARELATQQQIGKKYQIQPFPRKGEYVEIRPCRWGLCDKCWEPRCNCPNKNRVPRFRWPDKDFLEGCIITDLIRLARSKEDVKVEVEDTMAAQRQLQAERLHWIQDAYGIRELAETETDMLIRNPSLRKEPELMLSPAVAKKRVRQRIANTL